MDGDPRDEPTREPTSPEPDAGPLQSDEAAADEAAADEAAERPEDEPWPRLRRVLVFAAWCLALAGGGLVAAAVVQVDQLGGTGGSAFPLSAADRFLLLGQAIGPTTGMLAIAAGLLLAGVRVVDATPARGAVGLGLVVAVVVGGVAASVDAVAVAVRAAGVATEQVQRQQPAVSLLVESTGFLVGLAAAAVGAAGLRLPAPPALDQTLEQASPSGL